MASIINVKCEIDGNVVDDVFMRLQRGFYKIKRKAIRRTLRSVAQEAREILRQNKLRSKVPSSGTYYGRTYGRLTGSIRHNEESGTVSAGGNGIYHAEIEDNEDYTIINPVYAPRLKFIWWRLGGGMQYTRRYKVKKSRLVISEGPIYRKGSGYMSRPWRENIAKLPELVIQLAKEEGII
jgi:hypothetical protein